MGSLAWTEDQGSPESGGQVPGVGCSEDFCVVRWEDKGAYEHNQEE